jgi:hypothetical protein
MFQRRVEDLKPKDPVTQNPVTNTAQQDAAPAPTPSAQVDEDAAEVGNLPYHRQALSHPVIIKVGVSLLVIFVLVLLFILAMADQR